MTIVQKYTGFLLLIFILPWFTWACFAVDGAASEKKVPSLEKTDPLTPFSGVLNNQESVEFLRDFHTRLEEVEQERVSIKNNLDWIALRIRQMEDLDRFVPQSMRKSLAFKKNKLAALKKQKIRLETLLHSHPDLEALLEKKQWEFSERNIVDDEHRGLHAEKKIPGPVHNNEKQPYSKKLNIDELEAEIRSKIEKSDLGAWVEVITNQGCLKLETRLPVLFASGSAVIVQEYKGFFKKLASLIKEYDIRVLVDGYADKDSIHTETYPSNFELGAARAANVVHELIRCGIEPSVFTIGSSGRYRHQAKGMSKRKTLERRADLTIVISG
ncbi:MAG: OmpA family protein [Thermodesulfobacteriota bacterium]|nr:OmpA family protein [Thermodesulfobacteriota bacterium]